MESIRIGEQEWTAKNMAVTIDKDGKELVFGKDYFYPYDDESKVEKYGLLYTWEAANRIAPNGWHLPTDEEWRELENFFCQFQIEGYDKYWTSTDDWLGDDYAYIRDLPRPVRLSLFGRCEKSSGICYVRLIKD